MQTTRATLIVMTIGLSLTGCVSPQGETNNTATGALIGGVAGAIIGGSVARNTGVGAAIGGGAGVIAGGLIGHSMDQAQKSRLQKSAPQTWQSVEQGQPLSIADVKALANAGVNDELIISQISNTRTVYRLATTDIISLKNAGVSEKVINFMINTPSSALTPPSAVFVTSEPPPPIRETVVVASPSPGYVWIHGAWVWHGSSWGWCAGHWAMPPHPRAHWMVGTWEPGHGRRMWRPGHWR